METVKRSSVARSLEGDRDGSIDEAQEQRNYSVWYCNGGSMT